MRAAVFSAALVMLVVVGAAAIAAPASAACDIPTPNPSQATSNIELQIGDASPNPTPSPSCTPSVSPTPAPSLASTAGGSSGGTRAVRGAVPASSNTPQAAAAGAPGAPVPGAEPVPGADALSLNPDRVHAGERVLATAKGYTPGERIQLVVYPNPVILGSYTADSTGALRATITVPVDTKTGGHTVEAAGWISHHASNGRLVVVTAELAAGPISPTWWLIGIGILLLFVILVTLIVFRSAIARMFADSRLPEPAS